MIIGLAMIVLVFGKWAFININIAYREKLIFITSRVPISQKNYDVMMTSNSIKYEVIV